MSAWLVAFVGMIYLAVALDQAAKGNTAMCVVYLGYAFSNIGLYVLAKG